MDDIDKPSALMAVIVGLAASLLIDVSTGPREVEAQEAPRASARASGPTTRAGCPTESLATKPLPAPSPAPAGPTDRQLNSSGTGSAGAAGTIAVAPNDPCERAKALNPRTLRPGDAASAPTVPAEANPARQP
jgi:hypothetical protein